MGSLHFRYLDLLLYHRCYLESARHRGILLQVDPRKLQEIRSQVIYVIKLVKHQ